MRDDVGEHPLDPRGHCRAGGNSAIDGGFGLVERPGVREDGATIFKDARVVRIQFQGLRGCVQGVSFVAEQAMTPAEGRPPHGIPRVEDDRSLDIEHGLPPARDPSRVVQPGEFLGDPCAEGVGPGGSGVRPARRDAPVPRGEALVERRTVGLRRLRDVRHDTPGVRQAPVSERMLRVELAGACEEMDCGGLFVRRFLPGWRGLDFAGTQNFAGVLRGVDIRGCGGGLETEGLEPHPLQPHGGVEKF